MYRLTMTRLRGTRGLPIFYLYNQRTSKGFRRFAGNLALPCFCNNTLDPGYRSFRPAAERQRTLEPLPEQGYRNGTLRGERVAIERREGRDERRHVPPAVR